jgi:hypothetical protein
LISRGRYDFLLAVVHDVAIRHVHIGSGFTLKNPVDGSPFSPRPLITLEAIRPA